MNFLKVKLLKKKTNNVKVRTENNQKPDKSSEKEYKNLKKELNKKIEPVKKEIKSLEESIASFEKEIAAIEKLMAGEDFYKGNHNVLEVTNKYNTIKEKLKNILSQWEKRSKELSDLENQLTNLNQNNITV